MRVFGTRAEHAGLAETEAKLLSEGRISEYPCSSADFDAMEHLLPDVLSAVGLAQHQLAKMTIFGGFSRAWTSVVINFIETCLREVCPRVCVL